MGRQDRRNRRVPRPREPSNERSSQALEWSDEETSYSCLDRRVSYDERSPLRGDISSVREDRSSTRGCRSSVRGDRSPREPRLERSSQAPEWSAPEWSDEEISYSCLDHRLSNDERSTRGNISFATEARSSITGGRSSMQSERELDHEDTDQIAKCLYCKASLVRSAAFNGVLNETTVLDSNFIRVVRRGFEVPSDVCSKRCPGAARVRRQRERLSDDLTDDRDPLMFSLSSRDSEEVREDKSPLVSRRNRRQDRWSDEASSQNTKTSEGGPVELPGFYYDPEQKKYFKISENPYNAGSSAYTREKIQEMDKDRQRRKDVEEFAKRPTTFPQCNRTVTSKPHIPGLLMDMQTRGVSSRNLDLFNKRHHCANLKLSSSSQVPRTPNADYVGYLEGIFPNRSLNKILCLWETRDGENNFAQLMDIQSNKKNEEEKPTISFEPWGRYVLPIFDRITCIRMAPWFGSENRVIYTLSDPSRSHRSSVNLTNLEYGEEYPYYSNSTETWPTHTYVLREYITRTCAWNKLNQRISVGIPNKAVVLDILGKIQNRLNTNKSDPLSQTFHSKDQFGLFSGTRKGEILRHDTRAGEKATQQWQQSGAVGHLHSQETDGNCFLASNISGQIYLYDTRHKGVVTQYEGFVNTHKQIHFYLDESETILHASGTDSYTYMWDVKSGEMLVRIPPPIKETFGYLPRAIYSTQWDQGKLGNALIMGMEDRLFVYQ